MVQNEKSKVEEKFQESPQLTELRKQRQALNDGLYKNVQNLEQAVKSGKFDEVASQLSKLDGGIKHYNDHFKGTIADAAMGLTDSLQGYVQFATNSQNYTFSENVVKFFNKPAANRRRLSRMKNEGPKQSLDRVLSYCEQLIAETLDEKIVALKKYDDLDLNTKVIGAKINEYQPREEALKAKKDEMEAQYAATKLDYDNGDAVKQAELTSVLQAQHDALQKTRVEYDEVFTVYQQAQQIYKASMLTRDSFEQMARDLGLQAVSIKEKMDNAAQIYAAAPEAVKIMMATKGYESLDKTVNLMTTECVDTITKSAESVADGTMKRRETAHVNPELVRGYIKRLEDMFKDIDVREAAIRKDARQSDNERYSLNNNN